MASKLKYTDPPSKGEVKHRRTQPPSFRQTTRDEDKTKNCYFYKDGDNKFAGVRVCINPRRYKRLDALITDLSTKVRGLPYGVRSIFTPRGRDMITSLDNLENNESYVCSTMRHQARGVDPNRVLAPPRWHFTKPSSGNKEYNTLLQEQEFENEARYVGRQTLPRDARMAYAYNRNQPKKITCLKNGDPVVRHVVLINRRTAQTFEQILSDLSGMFLMAIRKLYTIEGKKITNLTAMINGPDVLVAGGKEPFKSMRGFVYEPLPPEHSPTRRSRIGMYDRNASRMRSRTDFHQDGVATRLKKRRDRMMKTRGNWRISCTTNELPTAGTHAQVFITVYGHKGNSGPVPLGFPDNSCFNPGQEDDFELNLGAGLGEIYKIRISHDNTGEFPGWLCDEIRMVDTDTDEKLVFPCRRWLSREEDDHEICREIPAVRKGEPHLPIIKYEVAVVTGDLWNGATDANVYLTIYGDRGDSGVRQLYVSDKERAFNKGQTNRFTIEAVSLGHLKRVIVGHDGTVPGDGWFLEKLSIQEPDAKPHEIYQFYCGRWLDEGEDDGKIVRELKVQDEYMDDILEKRNWEFEKWKFESKNQVMFISKLTGKSLRIKGDGSVDGLGEEEDPGSVFIVSSKKPMVRIFTSLLNGNYHMAIDHGKITGQGRGGPQCEFRLHVQSDRTVMLEGAKAPLQFVTLEENGKLGDSRSTLDKDPAKRFHVYAKGVMRHRGIIMLKTSNTQAVSVDHDKNVYATGRCNKAAHFRVHKVADGGIRMFESMIYPGFYLRMKEGKLDCNGSRNEESHFLVEKHKDKGYFTLQQHKQRGMYVGFTPRGTVRPTIDSGTNNIHVFPEVVEFGISKQQLTEEKLTPISEGEGYMETPRSRVSPDSKQPAKLEIEEGDFRVLVSTTESMEQGKVALVVFGDKGNSGPIILQGPTENGPLFKAGNSDEFKVNLATVGKINKVRLELIPRSQNREPSWKVQKLMLTDMNTQEKLVFNYDRWLSREREDQDLMRELPVVRVGQEKESLPVVKYVVTVYTGKDPGSETEAQIYINMFGDIGDCGKRWLRLTNRPTPFQRGQADTFELEAVHLGSLSKIQIGHSETRPGDGWFLDKVVVREGKSANMEFVFPCGRWFDSGMEDRKLERIVLVQEPAPTKISPEELPIEKTKEANTSIVVSTGSQSGAIMQDTVVLYVYGSDGKAGPVQLGSGNDDLFKPGTTDEIKVNIEPDVGHPYKVRVGLMEEVFGYEWHLDKLLVKDVNSGNELQFDVDRWMSRQKDDCDVWRELPVTRPDGLPLPVVTYGIEVHTGDIPGADTEAPVFINLMGQRGDSGMRRLYVTQTEGKMFSQGKIDRFTLEAVSLGDITSVTIGHSDRTPGNGWYLSYVAITEKNSSDLPVETFFPCDNWLDAGHEDGSTERELRPGQRPKPKAKSSGEYTMWITTAEDSQPAYGGKATLVIYGEKGRSEDINLFAPNSTARLFEPGNSDEFEVSAGDIGEIYKIRVSRDDNPDWRAWHLEEVKLKDKSTDETYVFSFNRWMSRDMEDGDLSRELPLVAADKELLPVKIYEVQVTTGDHWAAETDATVSLTIFGSNGDAGARILHRAKKNGKRKFIRGGTDTFTVEAVDLKELSSVVVSHDGKGPGSGWFLEHVVIRESAAPKESFVFPCGRWLDEGEDDGKTERMLRLMELPQTAVSHDVPSECGGQWKITVRTSDFPGSDTRAQVYLTVHGTQDISHPIPLGDGSASSSQFAQGRESEFDANIGDIGEITKIRLEHDGRNNDPSWHVDWVQMKHADTGFDCLFTINRWLAEDQEDGQLFRECALETPGWMPTPVMRYLVLIQTGRLPNSGAHGGVSSICLTGTNGDSGQQLLTRPLASASENMKEGILDVYMLEAVSVGEITSVRLGFEGKGRAKNWFVESVKVMESLWSLSEHVFRANCWLDDDENSAVVLGLSETGVATSLPNGIDYALLGHKHPDGKGSFDIWVWTGAQESAGTTDPVHLVLYGTAGPSTPVHLNKDSELRPSSCIHTQVDSVSIGQIFKLRLSFPDKVGNSSWFLERIKLKDKDTKQEFNFEYSNWIQSTNDNLDGLVEIPAIRPDIAPLRECTYKVKITTGNLPCSETSAEVNFMLIGQWGDSGQCYLNKSLSNREPFKRGQTDDFELKLLYLGNVSKLFIGHDEHGRGRGWFCEQVVLTATDEKGAQSDVIFACNRWFDTGVDDRRTVREFTPLGSISHTDIVKGDVRAASRGIWTCQVRMAAQEKMDVSEIASARSHLVSLVIYGTHGVTGPMELGETQADRFAPGQVETFKGLNFGNIGEPTKVRVSSGIEGDKDAMWTIEEVILQDETTKEKLHFDFSGCVGQIGGDVRKERPVLLPGAKVPPLVTYTVRVHTEDVDRAGTTAKVYATLYGSKGDSGRRLLHTKEGMAPFRQGQKLQFEIEAVDLGDLEKMVLTKGPGDPWMLSQAVVKAGPFGPLENVFIWSNWIGSSEERDKEVEVTLPVISGKPSSVAVPTTDFPDFPITRGHWTMEAITGPEGTRGDATDVVVVFAGTKGESTPAKLKFRRDNPFQAGMTDSMELNLTEDVGDLVKVRLGFEDNSEHKSWHVKKVVFEDTDTRDTFWFTLNDHVKVDDVADGWKEFPVVWPGIFILPIIQYSITVETGDVPEAGTSAQIMLKVDGETGSTGFRMLKDTRTSEAKFQLGQSNTFVIEAVSLMNLESVTIGHANKSPGMGWFLNKVTVRPSSEEEDYVFPCNRWLDAGQDDGLTMRTLHVGEDVSTIAPETNRSSRMPSAMVDVEDVPEPVEEKPVTPKAQTPEPEPQPEPPAPPQKAFSYEVTTVTGTGVGHKTKSDIVLILYGDKGHSEALVLEQENSTLGDEQSQLFEISTDENVGDLYKIRVGFENAGKEMEWYTEPNSCPSWFGDMIKLRDKKSGKAYEVLMKQWVRMEDDHDYWREFPVAQDNPSDTLPVRDYLVDVFTGQQNGSGTNGHVFLQLSGDHGDSGLRHLHGSRTNANKFETGSHDLFRIEAVDLGKLNTVKIHLEGYGQNPTWYLDKVEVKESEESSQVFVFECDRWLSGEAPSQLTVELPLTSVQDTPRVQAEEVVEAPEEPEEEKPKPGDWRVYVMTSSEPGSGTDAKVTLTVLGDKGSSGPLVLGAAGQDFFSEGQTDQFDVWLEPEDVGQIQKVRLEHDDSGQAAGWRVDQLVMENLFNGEKLSFVVNRWLSFADREGDIVCEVAAEYPDRTPLKSVKYVVKTVTEAQDSAGTQAIVYINIIGSQGDSGKRCLKNNLDENEKFAIGKTNYFHIEAIDLGALQKIWIGHDGSGPDSAWKLQCVLVRDADAKTRESFVFPWGKWLSSEEQSEAVIIVADEMVSEDVDGPSQDEPADGELKLELPYTNRTENDQPTLRTDEGYQEDYGPSDTDAALTARMYTASDSSVDPFSQRNVGETARDESVIDEENENSNKESPASLALVDTARETEVVGAGKEKDAEDDVPEDEIVDTTQENAQDEAGKDDGSIAAEQNDDEVGEEDNVTAREDVDTAKEEDNSGAAEEEENDPNKEENDPNKEENEVAQDTECDDAAHDTVDDTDKADDTVDTNRDDDDEATEAETKSQSGEQEPGSETDRTENPAEEKEQDDHSSDPKANDNVDTKSKSEADEINDQSSNEAARDDGEGDGNSESQNDPDTASGKNKPTEENSASNRSENENGNTAPDDVDNEENVENQASQGKDGDQNPQDQNAVSDD
ncbi:lipoxygenase homology domain-containing protein 1 isoform X2 [Aplysia californica]|uniref:Lipoxygenase homology domain-containing protein 1 isoform X2 n=1 Tax=Aplysia californica TaxID=6500 RepID=A0ABM1A2Y9_APLCA|nr:lipoxygenase homology domain-containing protein 1 isoform X2 [Aplysia californica]